MAYAIKTANNCGCYHIRSYFYYNQFGSDDMNKAEATKFITAYQDALNDLSPYTKP